MIKRALAAAFHWLSRALSEGDGTPSSKRLFFAAAVFAAIAFCAYDIIRHNGLTPQTIDLSKTVLYVTATAYGVTRLWAEGSPPNPPPAPATA